MLTKKPKSAKCPWCGTVAPLTKKDALRPHLTAGQQQCCAAGIPRYQWPPERP
jgi:hypothetical protein